MAGSGSITRFEQAALTLAERGYHVFPCQPRDKRPLTSNGFKDSTRDERQILHWWDQHPDANVAVDCGGTGIVVFDIDAKHGADPEDVLADHDLYGAPVVLTGEAPEPGGSFPRSLPGVRGAQVFFRGAERTTDKLTVPGTEIRSIGAYVVVPPSVHPSGVPYEGDLPAVRDLPATPAWLTNLIQPTSNGPAAEISAVIPKGEQHHTLVSLAGSMRRRGMDADEIEAALMVTNLKRLEDPAPPEDIRKIAQSVAKYPPAQAANGTNVVQMQSGGQVAAMALTELLDLTTVNVRIQAARVFGKGSNAAVEIDMTNGETLSFGSLREMMRPQAVIAEVAACTGATPTLKQAQCAHAITLVKAVAKVVEMHTENDIAREWGRDYLRVAQTIDIDINDQAERWGAFHLIAEHGDPYVGGTGVGNAPAAGLVLRHRDGSRFVRTLWFERYVKSRDSSVSRTVIGPRMAKVGWERRGKHGDIKATSPSRNETKTYPFWVVPANWMPDEPPTE
jgi:hypothetical protein